MNRLSAAYRPAAPAVFLLALAAVAVFVAGFEHARLWHRGYAEVDVLGPLFLLNAIASAGVICVGSLISIYISHHGSFFRWRDGGYDGTAKLIVAAEIAGTVLALLGAAAGGLRHGAAAQNVASAAA